MTVAITQAEVDEFTGHAPHQTNDYAVVQLVYPKASSRRYRCDFRSDTGWPTLGAHDFEPMQQVAIDEDWSALRFHCVGFIEKMIRSGAISKEGKKPRSAEQKRRVYEPYSG